MTALGVGSHSAEVTVWRAVFLPEALGRIRFLFLAPGWEGVGAPEALRASGEHPG